MNEIDTLLAAKIIKQLQNPPTAGVSDAQELINGLTADKNSLHLCFHKAYPDEDKPAAEMTLEEYRSYIENKINCFIMHPQQKKVNYTIHITETGLLSMQSDKKYEKHILNSIQTAFRQPYFSPFSENCLLYFDDKDNNCSMSWSSINNIETCPAASNLTVLSSDTHTEPKTEPEKEYTFKRMSPISVLFPSSRYAKALYAYNIASDG